MNEQFSIKDILGTAWHIAKKNVWIIMGFTAIQFMVLALIYLGLSFTGPSGAVILELVKAFFMVVICLIFFNLIDEEGDPTFPDFLPSAIKTLKFFAADVIIKVMMIVVILLTTTLYLAIFPIDQSILKQLSMKNIPTEVIPLLISAVLIPIIFFTVKTWFVICCIIDQDSGIIESIKQSWTLTKGHFWFLLLLFLVIFGLNILGAMAFFVGLLFTFPLSIIILLVTYRQMVNSHYADEDDVYLENTDQE